MTPTDDDGAQAPPQQPQNEPQRTPPQPAVQATRAHATERRDESAEDRGYFFMDSDTIEELSKQSRGAPFSDFLGMPVLSNKPPKARLFQSDAKVSFGFGLLSSSATPLSSMLGLPVLKFFYPSVPWSV